MSLSVLFLAFFGPDMKTEMGVVIFMYLNYFPDYMDSKYIWVHGFNSLGSCIFAEIPFLAFLVLHWERKRCGQVDPSTCYSQSGYICITNFRSVAPWVFLAKVPFSGFPCYHSNHFPDFFNFYPMS